MTHSAPQFRRVKGPTRADVFAVAGRASGMVRSTEFAAHLGVHPRTIRRCYERQGLPGAKEHGPRILKIPARLLRLAEAYGLRWVESEARAGRLPA